MRARGINKQKITDVKLFLGAPFLDAKCTITACREKSRAGHLISGAKLNHLLRSN
jgi:hypothetical protein